MSSTPIDDMFAQALPEAHKGHWFEWSIRMSRGPRLNVEGVQYTAHLAMVYPNMDSMTGVSNRIAVMSRGESETKVVDAVVEQMRAKMYGGGFS